MNSDKIVLPLVNGKVKAFNLQDILFCKSNGYLSIVYYKNKSSVDQFTVNKRLGTLEEMLDALPIQTYRTHRSYIVNARNIMPYIKYPSNDIEFFPGVSAKLSRRKKLDFHKFYKQLHK